MSIHLIAIGNRMPSWVKDSFNEYAKRLPREWRFKLTELNPPPQKEEQAIEAALDKRSYLICLHEHGTMWSSTQLAQQLNKWLQLGQPINFVIGGPDGLAKSCLAKANELWSLSPLTLPHPLVRVVMIEQLYRAHSLLIGHPYHRA